jgi:hypothetical protein
MSTSTPWGAAQHSKVYAPGITFFSTASHGGFRLTAQRVAQMPDALRAIVPCAHEHNPHSLSGPGAPRWYEEDCDWALVALAFPEHFRMADVLGAVETAGMSFVSWRAQAQAWLTTDPEGIALRERAEAWKRDNGHLFRLGGACTAGEGWRVHADRIDGAERITIQFDDREGVYNWQERNGYYQLESPFAEARIAELGGRVVGRKESPSSGDHSGKPAERSGMA